jgi:DNA-binding response OmpR family regulator
VILLVEDSEPALLALQSILEDADFLVLPASTAIQAFELAEACAFAIDLLITKLHPRDMPGPELARRLKNRSPGMSVLYTCGNPLAALEIPDAAEVVSSMLPMPLSREVLVRRINTLLAAHA